VAIYRELHFELKFTCADIKALASRYDDDDSSMEQAGKQIANGNYSRKYLTEIVRWKSQRNIALLQENSDADIRNALKTAHMSNSERQALETLRGLRGVEVPTASAILTAIDPSRWTVIDFRALEALGVYQKSPGVDFYLAYLSKCREIAKECTVDLRTLDRAMWQWSKERPHSHSR